MIQRLALLASLAVVAAIAAPIDDTAGAAPPVDDLEVILAIDASESMEPAIASAKAAAQGFADAMPAAVPIGLETFADEVVVLTPPTTDRALLDDRIESISVGGDTALYDAVIAANSQLTPTVEHRVLVVLSDGRDEGSAATRDDAVLAASAMHVEAISLTTSETDLDSLAALGPVTAADDISGLEAAFERVAGLLVEVLVPETSPPSTTTTTTTTTTTPTTTAPPTTAVPTTQEIATVAAEPATPAPPAPQATEPASRSTLLWVGALAVFAGLFMFVIMFFPRHRVSRARLGSNRPRNVSEIGVRTVSAIEEALERHGKRAALGNTLAVADIGLKPAEFVAWVLLVAVTAGLLGLFLGGPIIALLVAAAVCLGVRAYVQQSTTKRRGAFADQLPDVLQLVSTALRSGFGLTQALESVAEEAEEPARSEFAQVLVEVRLGRDLSESMHALADRMDSTDLEWVVSAIDINRDAGGNLAEVLDTVSATIRERARVDRHVRTLTAEGRLSARILTVLPLLMLVWQWRVNPDNFELLTYGVGLATLVAAGILMILGASWVRRLVRSVAL